MEEQQNIPPRPANPRRKQRSKMQIFKETYLPVIILGVAIVLVIVFIIGSIVRGVQKNNIEKQESIAASIAEAEKLEQLQQEAADLLARSASAAQQFDYDQAIRIIDSFSDDITQFPALSQAKDEYTAAMDALVLWDDPSQVLNLSFQILIADPGRAFTDATYGNSYNRNFVTVDEFSKILLQLYENGYILVRMSDIISDDGTTQLYLPNGKKPLILTQTNVNYNTYMLDSDGDKLPDAGGDGFASKLVVDANGNITCEMVDSTGQTVTGAYDLVPILDAFIETHPDFSYKGAKAILAVTGYDGLFGYRTNPAAQETFGADYYNEQLDGAKQVIAALRDEGYELACYTYENEPYGNYTAAQIEAELNKWSAEVTPLLGDVDIFVFARNSDIADSSTAYSGEKFQALRSFGFQYYLGFCTDGARWFNSQADYIRMGRILVGGTNMKYHSEWFEGIFDPASVLDDSRGTIPS